MLKSCQVFSKKRWSLNGLTRRNLHDSFFANGIVSNDHAYVAGWLVTDAHFNKERGYTTLTLQFKDYDALQTLQNILCCDDKIVFTSRRKGHSLCGIRWNSKQFTENALALFPCDHHQKADTLSSLVPLFNKSPDYISSFIRGVMDGDGSLGFDLLHGTAKWKISGNSRDFIEGIRELIFADSNIEFAQRKYRTWKGKDHFVLETLSKEKAVSFGEWLYKGPQSMPKLERKYRRYKVTSDIYENHLRNRKKRSEILGKHLEGEFREKIEVLQYLKSIMNDDDQKFRFTNSFIQKMHLTEAIAVHECERLMIRLKNREINSTIQECLTKFQKNNATNQK